MADTSSEAPPVAASTYLVRVWVQGLRDGKPWPKPGETIELTDAEARDYLLNGYIVAPDDAGAVPDPAAPDGQDPVHGLTTANSGLVAAPASVTGSDAHDVAGELTDVPHVDPGSDEPAPGSDEPKPHAPRIAKR